MVATSGVSLCAPPRRQSFGQNARWYALVMRYVVQPVQLGMDVAHEVEDADACRALIEPVPVSAHVETQQTPDEDTVDALMRYDQDVPSPLFGEAHVGRSGIAVFGSQGRGAVARVRSSIEKAPAGAFRLLVEVVGIEPTSASPLPRGLHAYSVFSLAMGYPTDREDS